MVLLAWAARSAGDCACCVLECPIYLGGALPDTRGLKMFLATRRGATGGLAVKTLAPYHVLAARGFPQPGRVNLSTLGHPKARRAAEAAMPPMLATASILAAMRVKNMKVSSDGRRT